MKINSADKFIWVIFEGADEFWILVSRSISSQSILPQLPIYLHMRETRLMTHLLHYYTFTLLHFYTFTLLFYCLSKEWKYHRSICLIATHWDFSSLRQQSQIQPGNSVFAFFMTHHHQDMRWPHLSFSQLYHSPGVSLIPRKAWFYILSP